MLDRLVGSFFAALWRLIWLLPGRIASGYDRYFAGLRWVEFAAAVTAAYQGAVQIAPMLLGVSPEVAAKFGVYVAVIGALCYLRNPKKKNWSETTDATDAEAPARA